VRRVPTSPADPRLWSILSTIALAVAIVGFITGGGFAWLAFAASGVFFLIERVLKRRAPDPG
jgi:O-antigen ligase